MVKLTEGIKHIIIINVILFVGTLTYGQVLYDLFALHFPKNDLFQPWQLVSCMFMHATYVPTPTGMTLYVQHILFNMFMLWMFGGHLESFIGKFKFVFLYISAGVGGALLSILVDYIEFYHIYRDIAHLGMNYELVNELVSINASEYNYIKGNILYEKMLPILKAHNFNIDLIDENSFEVLFKLNVLAHKTLYGASGAVMGVMAAYGYSFPNREVLMLIPPVRIKIKYIIVGMIGSDIVSAILTGASLLDNNVGYVAHVGGALVGFLMMWYWKKADINKRRLN